MAIVLGGVVLSDHMIWEDEITSSSSVAQVVKRTLAGTLLVQEQQLSGGVPITLSATDKQGWLTKVQVVAIKGLAEQAGLLIPLTIGSNTYTVVFRHTEDPAFYAEPLDQIGAQAPAGYYTAVIKLMTI